MVENGTRICTELVGGGDEKANAERPSTGRLSSRLAEELVDVQLLVPDSSRHMLDALLRSSQHNPQSAEVELLAKDGSRVPVYLSASASWDAEVRLTYVLATDRTDQKRGQAIVAAEGLASLIVD